MKNINRFCGFVNSVYYYIVFYYSLAVAFFFKIFIIAKLINFRIFRQSAVAFPDLVQKIFGGTRVLQTVDDITENFTELSGSAIGYRNIISHIYSSAL